MEEVELGSIENSLNIPLNDLRSNLDKLDKIITEMLAKNAGKTYEQLEKDMERDNWMNAKEAVEYGLCDEIISKIEL